MIKKLGLTINVFDNNELLDQGISSIKKDLDYVVAVYQKKSYWGNKMEDSDWLKLVELQKQGIIDELLEFKADTSKYSREQETDKRNFGIDYLKSKGFSHVLNIDSDEFYNPDQFHEAKELISKKGYNVTYCTYVNYYKDFDHYLVYPFVPYVNFINSTYFRFQYNIGMPNNLASDPTRRISMGYAIGLHIFDAKDIIMNHSSWIRPSIRKKLVNWSAKDNFDKSLIDKAVQRYETWEEGQPAIMLFNVPNNEVTVKKMERRICDINIPWLKKE